MLVWATHLLDAIPPGKEGDPVLRLRCGALETMAGQLLCISYIMRMPPNMAVKIAVTIAKKMERMMMAGMAAMAAFTMKTTMDQKGIWMSTTVTRLLESFMVRSPGVCEDSFAGEVDSRCVLSESLD
ncbi:MAG: hypothetical protein KFB96_22245 [Thiocapsa sp.]|uniref:hypothetical protein n=1 Tax=Thiocapsa sp. TaxID=2024551 RepID=UPI001BCEAAD1|nr:hypothetical protein [Thiocapsa sp.]QVL48308.1 MAG: hypothetical protein KFB96_22245 [Thiocapsa sp.]